jgi:hypothetical protein
VAELAHEHNLITLVFHGLAKNPLAVGVRVVGRGIKQVDTTIQGLVDKAKSGLVVHAAPRVVVAELPGPVAHLGHFKSG